MGRPEEFDSLTLSPSCTRGPSDGTCSGAIRPGRGAKRDALKPALTLADPGWVGRYEVYRWAGDGVEAAPGCTPSRRPSSKNSRARSSRRGALEDGGVKRWLGEMSRTAELTCFSYLEKMRSADEAAPPGATRGRAEISWRDTTLVGDFFDDAAKRVAARLGALSVGGGVRGEALVRVSARVIVERLGSVPKAVRDAAEVSHADLRDAVRATRRREGGAGAGGRGPGRPRRRRRRRRTRTRSRRWGFAGGGGAKAPPTRRTVRERSSDGPSDGPNGRTGENPKGEETTTVRAVKAKVDRASEGSSATSRFEAGRRRIRRIR